MNRKISFTEKGDIRVESETATGMMTEIIRCGVVLLTLEQVREAEKHGWKLESEKPYSTDTDPWLYAVKKGLYEDRSVPQRWR